MSTTPSHVPWSDLCADDFQAPDSGELFRRWERQSWCAHSIDLSEDREQWLALDAAERWQWFCLAGFAHFRISEIHGMDCLTAFVRAMPRPEDRMYLATQVADEARHAAFFSRYYAEVVAAKLPEQAIDFEG